MGSQPSSGGEAEHTLDLLNRARAGDEAAWDRLYERYQGEVRCRVRARFGSELRDVEESADVFQSVWREAIGSLKNFQYRGEGSFLAWLATVLRNKLASRVAGLRTAKRAAKGAAPTGSVSSETVSRQAAVEPGPGTRVENEEDRELLLQTVEELPPAQRDLVRWALLEGRTYHEIGHRLGIGEDAARMRVSRAEAKLTVLFQRLHGDSEGRPLSRGPAEE